MVGRCFCRFPNSYRACQRFSKSLHSRALSCANRQGHTKYMLVSRVARRNVGTYTFPLWDIGCGFQLAFLRFLLGDIGSAVVPAPFYEKQCHLQNQGMFDIVNPLYHILIPISHSWNLHSRRLVPAHLRDLQCFFFFVSFSVFKYPWPHSGFT